MSHLNVGIVGLGWVAGAHIDAFKAVTGADVAAVCSRRTHDDGELSARFGTPLRSFVDYEAMLADPGIHVVDICTPHPFHADQAVAAAEAGKHLIIEKPIAPDRRRRRAHPVRGGPGRRVRLRLLRMPVQRPLHHDPVRHRPGTARRPPLRRSRLLPRHRTVVRPVRLEREEGLRGHQPADGRVPRPGRPAVLHGRQGGGSHRLQHEVIEPPLRAVRVRHDERIHPEVRGRGPDRQGDLLHRLPAALLFPRAPGGAAKAACWTTGSTPTGSTEWTGAGGAPSRTSLIDSGDVQDHPYEPQFQAFVDSIGGGRPMPLTDMHTAYESHRVVFAADRSAAEGRPVRLDELD